MKEVEKNKIDRLEKHFSTDSLMIKALRDYQEQQSEIAKRFSERTRQRDILAKSIKKERIPLNALKDHFVTYRLHQEREKNRLKKFLEEKKEEDRKINSLFKYEKQKDRRKSLLKAFETRKKIGNHFSEEFRERFVIESQGSPVKISHSARPHRRDELKKIGDSYLRFSIKGTIHLTLH